MISMGYQKADSSLQSLEVGRVSFQEVAIKVDSVL